MVLVKLSERKDGVPSPVWGVCGLLVASQSQPLEDRRGPLKEIHALLLGK